MFGLGPPTINTDVEIGVTDNGPGHQCTRI